MFGVKVAALFRHITRTQLAVRPVTVNTLSPVNAFQVFPAKPTELKEILRLSTEFDWVTSENILRASYKTNPHSYAVAKTEEGNIVGCVLQYVLNNDVWYGAMHLVKHGFRAQGIGDMLFYKYLRRFPEMNGSATYYEDRVEFAANHGFPIISFQLHHMRGKKKPWPLQMDGSVTIIPYHSNMEANLAAYDATVNTIYRRQFLSQWLNPWVTKTFVATSSGSITGYGCVQPMWCGDYHIGPLLANTPDIANSLLQHICSVIPDDATFSILTPSLQRDKMPFLNDSDFSFLRLNRVYTLKEIPLPLDKIFAITSTNGGLT